MKNESLLLSTVLALHYTGFGRATGGAQNGLGDGRCALVWRSDAAGGVVEWYHSGMPVVPIRWVLIRDPQAEFEPQALLSTGQTAAAQQIVEWFVLRWQVEVTFEEARAHLGIETQR